MQFTLSTVAFVASLLSVAVAAPTPYDGDRNRDHDHEVEILACSKRGSRFHWDSVHFICVEVGEIETGSRHGSDHVSRDGSYGGDRDHDHEVEILACSKRGSRFHWDSVHFICVETEVSVSDTRFGASGERFGNNFRRDAAPHDDRDRDHDHEIEILACSKRGSRFHWDSIHFICVETEVSVSDTRFGESGSRFGNNFVRDAAPRDDRHRDHDDSNHEIEIIECSKRGSRFHWDSVHFTCVEFDVSESNSRSGRDYHYGN